MQRAPAMRAWRLGKFFFKLGSVVGEYRKADILHCLSFIGRPAPVAAQVKKTMLSNENRPERPGYFMSESCQCHNPLSMVHYYQSNDSLFFLDEPRSRNGQRYASIVSE